MKSPHLLAWVLGALPLSLGTVTNPAWAVQGMTSPIAEDHAATPQIDLMGLGLGTLVLRGPSHSSVSSDFSDSEFGVGASQKLFRPGSVGSFALGWVVRDSALEKAESPLFLNRAVVGLQTPCAEISLGRTDQPLAHLVDFPLLRSSDLIQLTHPGNPHSLGGESEEQRYSNVASVVINQNLTYFEGLHVQHLLGGGGGSALNAFGASFEMRGEPGMESIEKLSAAGMGVEHLVASQGRGGVTQLLAGGVLKLNESVVKRWTLRAQNILSLGGSSDSDALVAAVGYESMPFGMAGWQASLVGGFQRYSKLARRDVLGVAANFSKGIGSGFDLVSQLASSWQQSQSKDQSVQLGLRFNFRATFNEHIMPQRTLLGRHFGYRSE